MLPGGIAAEPMDLGSLAIMACVLMVLAFPLLIGGKRYCCSLAAVAGCLVLTSRWNPLRRACLFND